MEKIHITERLLSLFLMGETTPDETYAILKAAETNADVAFFLEMYEVNIALSSLPESNQTSMSVCKSFVLHSRHLPALRLAASSEANDCVVKCEAYVLKQLGLEQKYDQLFKKASRSNWLQKEGTPLYNIGRLSELGGLSVSRQFHGSVDKLKKELKANCSVIVALNAEKLTGTKARSYLVNHAVVVLEIGEEEGFVELHDPQSSNSTDRYSIDTFLRAWKPAKNYFVSIIKRGVRPYKPHPEYVAHIQLPEEIQHLADILAENAHDIWAKDRLAEAKKKKNFNPFAHQFMKPFCELTEKEKRKTDYSTTINSIKLLYKLGFKINRDDGTTSIDYKTNVRTADGQYIPHPINVDDVILPKDIAALTEYIAENAHEEWAKQRLKEGWTFAPKKNEELMQNPDLIPYCELLDSEKEYDRKMAMNTLKVLYKFGYTIEKQ